MTNVKLNMYLIHMLNVRELPFHPICNHVLELTGGHAALLHTAFHIHNALHMFTSTTHIYMCEYSLRTLLIVLCNR